MNNGNKGTIQTPIGWRDGLNQPPYTTSRHNKALQLQVSSHKCQVNYQQKQSNTKLST